MPEYSDFEAIKITGQSSRESNNHLPPDIHKKLSVNRKTSMDTAQVNDVAEDEDESIVAFEK